MAMRRASRIPKGGYLPQQSRQALLNRLSRLEGQIKALKHKVQAGECADDLILLATAIRGATSQVAASLLEDHLIECATTCMRTNGRVEEVYERIAKALATVLKQS